uniref:Coiled-coil domain-containing protein n=1 Tax=Steinernema glaseri TaxID=37863 RepID=A0A1I7YSY0_9BILA
MSRPSNRKVAARANAQKARAAKKKQLAKAARKEQLAKAARKEQLAKAARKEKAWEALFEENRLLLERLQKDREQRLMSRIEAQTKADVLQVLQLAKHQYGPEAVQWTSMMTGTREETLREYEKELGTPVAPKKSRR